MQSMVMMLCLMGGVGDCARCEDPTARGWHYKHLRADSLRNGMPQSCYDPRYGCYPGNNRHMHRYPAFHGTFYRSPYNYRHLYDYPWHAQPHDPVPLHGEPPIGGEFTPLP